nr:MAG TPA: hypothetical protein [Caudoviricetes sp.]
MSIELLFYLKYFIIYFYTLMKYFCYTFIPFHMTIL